MHLLEGSKSNGPELYCAEMGYFQEIGFWKVGGGPWVYKLYTHPVIISDFFFSFLCEPKFCRSLILLCLGLLINFL